LQATISADTRSLTLADGQWLVIESARYPALKPGPVTLGIGAEALNIRPQLSRLQHGQMASFDFAEERAVASIFMTRSQASHSLSMSMEGTSAAPARCPRLKYPSVIFSCSTQQPESG
jgi:hypothetical protein